MALDYRHTCPDIDRSIARFKKDIEYYLINVSKDYSQISGVKEKEDLIKDYVNQMYNDFVVHFEEVRKTNEDMRNEADRQIDDAERENEELQIRIDQLEDEVSDLYTELDSARNQIKDLKLIGEIK